MNKLESAVPVLQVADVGKSIEWYSRVLGFEADPFPDEPPYAFAILNRDGVELMLQHNDLREKAPLERNPFEWAVYVRTSGGELLSLAREVAKHTTLLRGPERAFYGQVEFEVQDPDGHRLSVAEHLPSEVDVPMREE